MIAVIADASDRAVVSEFFELFKTPWEFYRPGERYEVVLCTADSEAEAKATRLLLVYAGRARSDDPLDNVRVASTAQQNRMLSCKGWRFPVYGNCVTFPQDTAAILIDEESRRPALRATVAGEVMRVRVGYDLFREVRTLLTVGQPLEHAGIPTLELHIALLRGLILASGAPFAEIPPVPDARSLIACLTHDVDHPSIRKHRFDHTMFGFLYRAVFGSLADALRGRSSFSEVLTNWIAAFKLPLVYLGLTDDFWQGFQDYPKIEKGSPSSFFIIPFRGRPGTKGPNPAPGRRAAGYGAEEITSPIRNLISAGCEIGLHGIDAWHDDSHAVEEVEEIRRITGSQEIGVRMHWLYFDEQSPLHLESAGATYDSTVGYNEAIGYRAGTTQAYKPLQATRLLELPLHVMDTALFYPGRLNLTAREARKQVDRMIDQIGHLGGGLTINWHDRSIAPERQWGRFYEDLLDELKNKNAWLSSAMQTVAWFRKRRSAVFETIRWDAEEVHVKVAVQDDPSVPGLQLRIHHARATREISPVGATCAAGDITMSLNGSIDAHLAFDPFNQCYDC